MKIIFFGLGSIGQRHARLLLKAGGQELFALRTYQADAPAPDFPIRVLKTWAEVDAVNPQVAFITNPTSMHLAVAIECAKRGMALFIEKPIDASTERLDELLAMVQQKNLTTYVAYCLRFHPIILYLKDILDKEQVSSVHVEATSFLPTWRPGRDHKKSYSSKRELGGGIVLDLSHEMDYVQFLLGQIKCLDGIYARRGYVTVDADDCADIYLTAVRGFASVHLSYLSHVSQRRITVCFPDRTLVADLISSTVEVYKNNVLIETISLPIERDVLFQLQLDYFLANIRNPLMMNNLKEASDLFRKICFFRENCYAT